MNFTKTTLAILVFFTAALGLRPFQVHAAGSFGMLGFGMMGSWQNTGSAALPTDNADINAALQDIYKSQNVSTANQIDCSKVADGQFEKLGDAYMGYVHPGQEHGYMEQMMGGEGSATLKQARVNMGRAYLGCWSNYSTAPLTMPMMGGYGMMFNSSSMMGAFGGYGWFGWITMVLVWTVLILGIVGLMKWLGKNKNQ
ncbi:hypothetical protein D4R52_00775 [bacterium]|nr:MAG: hypothetical protein D4R52_00775 [bacterium]